MERCIGCHSCSLACARLVHKQLSWDVVIVDTNDEKTYKMKHIKGAIHFPWAKVIGEPGPLPKDKLLGLYCGCIGEEASDDVAQQLMNTWGYKTIKVLEGGLMQWVKLGYPVEAG